MSEIPFHEDQWDEPLPLEEGQPVDEAEEFNDPYSDLSLFLSKKIKKELDLHGSLSNWTNKIQTELLQKILPEFKKVFPNYRLGANAVKKMWEKVSYYYSKVQKEEGAITNKGTLDIYYMVRENLRQMKDTSSPSHVPAYNTAHRLAVKLSECIATIDGVRPNLDLLTKTIWAAQKHYLSNLSPHNAKSPFEEYTKVDKLIVKVLLEICSHQNDSNPETLTDGILSTVKEYERISTLTEKGTLISTLSAILANNIAPTLKLSRYFDKTQKKNIKSFALRQLTILALYKDFTLDAMRIELVSRVLALYPLATQLPKDVDEQELRETIRDVYALNVGELSDEDISTNKLLFVYLNTEMHLFPNKEPGPISQEMEDEIVYSYQLATHLPPIPQAHMKELEVFLWSYYADQLDILKKTPIDIQEILFTELANTVIDQPKQSFSGTISQTARLLSEMEAIARSNDDEWDTIAEKTYIWALQQDMICRYIHFDHNTPLLKLMLEKWKVDNISEETVDHKEFIESCVDIFLEKRKDLNNFRNIVSVRATVLYKFMWYSLFAKTDESTYQRFLQYWKTALKKKHPKKSSKDLEDLLQQHVDKTLPLLPYSAS